MDNSTWWQPHKYCDVTWYSISKPSKASTSKPSTSDSDSAMPVAEKIKFPDLLSTWPFPRTCNPHSDVAAESDEWLESFKTFPTQGEMDAYKSCKFSMSTFPLWPWVSPDYPNRCSSPIVSLFSLSEQRLVPVEPHFYKIFYICNLINAFSQMLFV